MIQAAWAAIRKDPELKEFYQRIYRQHHKDKAARKAIVAVARKMTMRIHAVLSEQRPYVIHGKISSDSLTQEETLCPRGRLDSVQNQENLDSSDGSLRETETPGPLIPGNSGRLAQQTTKKAWNHPSRDVSKNSVRDRVLCRELQQVNLRVNGRKEKGKSVSFNELSFLRKPASIIKTQHQLLRVVKKKGKRRRKKRGNHPC